MENLNDKIAQLLKKAEWSDHEKQWLLKYLESSDNERLYNLLEQQFEVEKNLPAQLDSEITKRMLQNIHERTGVVQRINKASIVKIWVLKIAAACVIGLLVFSAYILFKRKDTKVEIVKNQESNKPNRSYRKSLDAGGNKAILTLADGSTIVLDDKQDGALTKQGNTQVIKLNGKLVYNSTNENSNEILYNTITTPAGGQYQIELPDGSVVWLNAGSSLHFPTAFMGKERRVEIKGEAYFEVKRNTAMPFTVKVNNAEVQVLGTKFNVMSYPDETVLKTTLLKGEVKFVHGNFNSILKPGQQTQLTKNGQVKVVSGIDVDEVVAWKNGMFDFEGTDIVSVARQISRWYDVEMVFDKKSDDLFYAKIPRNTNLKDVLKALELTGKVRFEIEGRKIIVKAH